MSGIFGICEEGRGFSASDLQPMLNPHVVGDESEHEFNCGHSVAVGVARRWSFQQMAAIEGVTLVADADLVDASRLAPFLSSPTHEAALMPRAELLARLYLSHGPDFLKVLHGAFALALWDEKKGRLLIAIDRMGIKSLYWRREGRRLLFASRLGGIRAVQRDAPETNATAVLQFLLFSAVPSPLTSDVGTQKLRPGSLVLFSASGAAERQYWDLEYAERTNHSVERWSRELRDEIRGAVHRHVEGCEQSVSGCYLSGGTDSSSVVAFASEKLQPAQSFTIGFQESGYSEIEFARTTANAFGTKHHEMFLSPDDAAKAIDKVIAYFDEPFANSSAIGSYYCALLAREHGVKTLLAGDGGDELFAGNERYAFDRRFALYHHLPQWVRRGLVEPLVNLLPLNDGKLSLPRKYVQRANIQNPRRILSYGFFLSQNPESVFEGDFIRAIGKENWLAIPEQHFSNARATCELNRILYVDLKMTLADNDLRKVSGTAELAGVNVRYPLLDTALAELSGRIPAHLKLKGFKKRFIFKKAMHGILPPKVLFKKKHGFGVPLSQWLLKNPKMSELAQDLLRDSRTLQRGYFRPGFYERLANLHAEQPGFYGEIVWYLMALELWHRRHMNRPCEVIRAS